MSPEHSHTSTHGQENTTLKTLTMDLKPWTCLLLLLFLVPAVLAAETTCSNDDPCELSCIDCTENEMVLDPENCRGYYVCFGGGESDYYSMPFDCPEGQVFNATGHECVDGDECDPCSALTGSCAYECPTPDGEEIYIPSFEDCQNYYICDGAATSPVDTGTCEALTPFFDGVECQTDQTKCCHCHAYCYTDDAVGTIIPDPLDCRRYYLCTNPSETPTNSGTCPDGENFDSMLGQCSSTATCKTACFNVLGPDGCIEPYTCLSSGFFARCPNQCTADYYHCTELTGEYQAVESCTSGTVFHPDTHTCVSPSQCPYTR